MPPAAPSDHAAAAPQVRLVEALTVPASALRADFAADQLPLSTAEIDPLERVAGQERALEAIAFGLSVDADGYNVAVSGPPSSGRSKAVDLLVGEAARAKPPASDWCYLYNFDDAYQPKAVALVAGLGDNLKRDLAQLVQVCRTDLPQAFDSEAYQQRSKDALTPINREREQAVEALRESAATAGFLVNMTSMGFVAVPKGDDGAPMPQELFGQLPEAVRQAMEERGRGVQESITGTVRDLRRLDVRAREAIAQIDREAARFVVGPVLDDLREAYPQPDLRTHFAAIEADILDNIDLLKRGETAGKESPGPVPGPAGARDGREALFRHYEVNLFVTHGEQPSAHAPVLDERQPTFHNLFGRLNYEARFGSMTTDFMQIRPGAIHMANGGYLILQLPDLLTDPRSWLKLKRSLKSKQARVEEFGETPLPLPVANLMPEPIPLDLKVVLVGPPITFAMLGAMDPDFSDLFKIRAEFEPDTPADADTIRSYVAFVRRSCDTCTLLPFERPALVEVLRYGTRLSGRQDRLSTRYGAVQDLCQEANQIASGDGRSTVTAGDVQGAMAAMQRRSGMVPDRMRQSIAEGTLRIETSGSVVGQVNGLAVYQVGGRAFGTPTRISCRTGAGGLGVVNIEREVERSGAIHSKGVLVLSGFLMGTFGGVRGLSFSASLTFEQSYDEVDGDSASSAELYAILTSLAGVAMRQDIAVTGSVDQFGAIQPVGGVTEKIEGFFDVCHEIGLTGTQGVVIPDTNRVNLTLREDVVKAVAAGQFQIWSVGRVEEGLALLTGLEAGQADAEGVYPPGTIFRRVVDALAAMRPAIVAMRTPSAAASEPSAAAESL